MALMTPLSRPLLRLERAARQPRYGRSPPADAPDNDYDDNVDNRGEVPDQATVRSRE